MAVGEPRFSKRTIQPLGPTHQTQPFDINLLCAKLEAAKREQDAERSRKYRPASSYGPPIAENYRMSMPVIDGALDFLSKEETRQRSQTERKRGASLFGTRRDRHQADDSRRSSASHDDIVRPIYSSKGSKHKSVAFMSDVFIEEYESPTQRSGNSQKSNDSSKRRSKPHPLEVNRLPLKHSTISTYDYCESPDSKSTLDESPMGMCNEYTISFDLADVLRDEHKRDSDRSRRKKRESQARPQWADGLGSRSLLNLSSGLKNRPRVETTELVLDSPNIDTRPVTASNVQRNHMRQKSLPIELGNEELARIKKEQREKKRRTFIGFFKVF